MFDAAPQAIKAPTTDADKLRLARSLIENPENWVTCMLRDGHRFCALGATALAYGFEVRNKTTWLDNGFRVPDALKEAAGPYGICGVNNLLGHAAVMAMFDRAIEIASA